MFLSFLLLIVRCSALKPPSHWAEPGLHVGMDTHSTWKGYNGHNWGVGEMPVVAETDRQLKLTGTCWPSWESLPCPSTIDHTSSRAFLAMEPLIPILSVVSSQPTVVLSPEALSHLNASPFGPARTGSFPSQTRTPGADFEGGFCMGSTQDPRAYAGRGGLDLRRE